jgi:long-chain acyl-CoA synthetase
MLEGRRTSIGPALPGQEVDILAGGSPAAAGVEGEVVIRGHCVMSGYLNNDQATQEVFRGGWFHTGDLGYYLLDESGRKYFHISGRLREIAKRAGSMVSLLEVDEVLTALPGVVDAGAAAFENTWVDEEIAAVVVQAPGAGLTPESIMEHCRRVLPFTAVPKSIEIVESVPRTASGKIRRHQISQRFAGLHNRLFTDARPGAGRPDKPGAS